MVTISNTKIEGAVMIKIFSREALLPDMGPKKYA